MRCRVIYASMGYNDHIYCKGEYVEVDTPEEVKRLVGYSAVEESPVEEKAVKERDQLQKAYEKSGTGTISSVTRPEGKGRGKKK